MKKRVLAGVLCAIMALSLCACGGSEGGSNGGGLGGNTEKKEALRKTYKQVTYDATTGAEIVSMEKHYDEAGREVYCKTTNSIGSIEEYTIEWKVDGDTAIGTYSFISGGESVTEAYDENTYDKDGNLLVSKTYLDGYVGKMTENEYKDGVLAKSILTANYMGGSTVVVNEIEYNENGNVIKQTQKINGEVDGLSEYQYEYDSDGKILKLIQIHGEGNPDTVSVFEYDENGYLIRVTSDAATHTDYENDEDGNALVLKTYNADGVLTTLTTYEYYK